MRQCIICGDPVDGRFDYCDKCFQMGIDELDKLYGKKEALSEPREENRESR